MEDLEFEEHPSEFLRYRRGANALSSVFMKKNLLVFFFIYAQQHKEERERDMLKDCFTAVLGNAH